MILGGEIRAADAAVWRRSDIEPRTGGYRRAAPILAVEVAGRDEDEARLHEKARWYLDRGVKWVWIVLPSSKEVVVIDPSGESRHSGTDTVPSSPELPGLELRLPRLFRQL